MQTHIGTTYTIENIAGIPPSYNYINLINPHPSAIREPASDAFNYSERHLQAVWFDPRLRPEKLTTSSGETVTVITPGRWNQEAGPDFLDAVLLLGPEKRRIQGDVEIHIHPADWNSHKHADDPHFKKIIAHITYTPPVTPVKTLPPGTVEISLKKALASIPSFSFESIDTTAYPYATLPDTPRPCARQLQKFTPEEIAEILEAAGAHRMQVKANRLKTKLRQTTADQLIYTEILAALGYKHNASICRHLARIIPYPIISKLTPLSGYALLLGVSGLIPSKPSPRWDDETKTFIRRVWNAWWQQQAQWQKQLIPKSAWKLSSIRPQNHPVRRLAAAAALVCQTQSPAQRLIKMITANADDAKRHTEKLTELFTAPPPLDYWHHHISLASKYRPKPIAIIGKSRISAININTILPYLAVAGHDIQTIAKSLPPEQSNTIIRQTAHALLGRDHNPDLYAKHALRQQGLIQIFHDFCLTDRTHCQKCPLPNALKNYS